MTARARPHAPDRERALASAGASSRGTPIILATAAALAVVLPCAAAAHLSSRISGRLEPALTAALGEQVSIGRVEAGLTGELRVSDVRVGRVFSASAVEASVALPSLLAGELDADEIRVEEPHIRARIDAQGGSNLGRLLDRVRSRMRDRMRDRSAERLPARDGKRATGRRIVVTGGDLVVDIDGWGRVQLGGVALHPHQGGLRAVAGTTRFHGQRGAYGVSGSVERVAADIALPGLAVPRMLAVGGALEIAADRAPPLALRQVSLSRGVGNDELVLHGRVAHAEATAAPAHVTARLARTGKDAGQDSGPGLAHTPGHDAGQDSGPALAHTPGHDAGQDSGPGARHVVHIQADDLPLAALAPLLPRGLDVSRARGRGQLAMTVQSDTARSGAGWAVGVDLDAALDHLIIDDPRVADAAMPVSGHARGQARITSSPRHGRRLDIAALRLTTGALALDLDGHVHYPASAAPAAAWLPASAELTVRVPALPCASALGALPPALRDRLTGLDMAGPFAAHARLALSRAASVDENNQNSDPDMDLDLALDLDVSGCRVLREAVAADPAALKTPFAHAFPDGSRAMVGAGQPGYVRLSALPGHVTRAFVSAEDARFRRHPGFDVHQIERSLAVNLRDGALLRGGSTISQQLVKNVFLTHRRTLARKLQEAVLTWRLEAHLSKDQILERYLNIIELGPGIFGIDAAAQHWFGKPATELSVRESAFLAALTRAPRTLSRRIAAARGIDPATARRVDVVLRAMRRDGALTESRYRRALAAPLSLRPDVLASR